MAQLERRTGDSPISSPSGGRVTNLTVDSSLCLRPIGRSGIESERFHTSASKSLIGRSLECDLVLSGDTISRVHAILRRASNGYILEDHSRNGTWVNGIRVRERLLMDGDQIRIGPHYLQVELVPARSTSLYPPRDTGTSNLPPQAEAVPSTGQIFVRGLEEGVTMSLTGVEVVIGRRPGNDILLEGEKISRDHALIRREGKSLRICDLGSANGTTINGRRIKRDEIVELQNGDRIRIGNYECLVGLREEDSLLVFKRMAHPGIEEPLLPEKSQQPSA